MLDVYVSKDYGHKPWLARIQGLSKKFGLEREFERPTSKNLSRSGETGTVWYSLDPGLYEVGGTKCTNCYFVVQEKGDEFAKEEVGGSIAKKIAKRLDEGESFNDICRELL